MTSIPMEENENAIVERESSRPEYVMSLRKWAIQSSSLGLLSIGVIGAVIYLRYGSLDAVVASMNRQSLLLERKDLFFGDLQVGQQMKREVAVRNISDHPVQLVGARNSCTCVLAGNLPLLIPAGEQRSMEVAARFKSASGPWRQTIDLFTDEVKATPLTLHLSGNIVSAGSSKK